MKLALWLLASAALAALAGRWTLRLAFDAPLHLAAGAMERGRG